ncbi:transmembrane protein 50B [Condylostylus longicornis]|uniref:transmembrane protein 50B n=1 Tax=Condylostylus longicornis TaxID=2530218 RepID=UPI00244DCF24|nr:transmembrane protein 50B [Condylostylus longicornis]
MSIIDNTKEWITGENAKNKISSIVAGLLFFTGWWLLIDVLASTPKSEINTGQAFIGVFGTLSFIMVNSVRKSHINQNSSVSRGRMAMLWLLVGFILGFASVIASVWVMIDDTTRKHGKVWPGVAILLQNVLILVATLIYKFGRDEEDY